MVMEVIRIKVGQKINIEESCVALGFFDGLHVGHLELLDKVIEITKTSPLKKALMTFDKHPKSFLTKQDFYYLSSLEDKIAILEEYGFDYLLLIVFDEEVANLLPEKFIDEYIIKQPIKSVVCGFDYHFGHFGFGTIKLLQEYAPDVYQTYVVEEKKEAGKKISSTYIRELLSQGNIAHVNTFLNRQYTIKGNVIHGRQIGRTIGFATANVDYGNYVLPKNGVYGVKVKVQEKVYFGMANIGYNPTFGDLQKPSLEVHIFDFDEDIYDLTIETLFCNHIRDEVRFASKEALIEQLNKDRVSIKQYFKN